MNYTMMHGSTNIMFVLYQTARSITFLYFHIRKYYQTFLLLRPCD